MSLWPFFLLQCITDDLRSKGINTSTSLPDDVLDFVRRHPLMSKQVQSADRRPLLFRRATDYTQMAAQVVQGLDEQMYHVLYMGTGAYETFCEVDWWDDLSIYCHGVKSDHFKNDRVKSVI